MPLVYIYIYIEVPFHRLSTSEYSQATMLLRAETELSLWRSTRLRTAALVRGADGGRKAGGGRAGGHEIQPRHDERGAGVVSRASVDSR